MHNFSIINLLMVNCWRRECDESAFNSQTCRNMCFYLTHFTCDSFSNQNINSFFSDINYIVSMSGASVCMFKKMKSWRIEFMRDGCWRWRKWKRNENSEFLLRGKFSTWFKLTNSSTTLFSQYRLDSMAFVRLVSQFIFFSFHFKLLLFRAEASEATQKNKKIHGELHKAKKKFQSTYFSSFYLSNSNFSSTHSLAMSLIVQLFFALYLILLLSFDFAFRGVFFFLSHRKTYIFSSTSERDTVWEIFCI